MIFDNCQELIEMNEYSNQRSVKNHANNKKVICITTNKTYSSVTEAAIDVGVTPCTISAACRKPDGKNYTCYLVNGEIKRINDKKCTYSRVFWRYL